MFPTTQHTFPRHSPDSPEHKWLALHFPTLALDIFQSQGVPNEQVQVVIQEQRVCHMNEAAAAAGILPGCTLATAYSISSELTYFERNPDQEQEHLADLAQALYRYSSVVSLEAPDCIVLEIRGSLMLLGNAGVIAQDALALCADMNHQAIARSAQTPQAAIALAAKRLVFMSDVRGLLRERTLQSRDQRPTQLLAAALVKRAHLIARLEAELRMRRDEIARDPQLAAMYLD